MFKKEQGLKGEKLCLKKMNEIQEIQCSRILIPIRSNTSWKSVKVKS